MSPRPNLDAVIQAFESLLDGIQHFYDRDSKEVIMVSSEFGEEGLDVERQTDRYVSIPPLTNNERFQFMEDFVESLSNEKLEEELNLALIEKGAFQRFEEALSRYPGHREQWVRFRTEKVRTHARQWMKANHIDHEIGA